DASAQTFSSTSTFEGGGALQFSGGAIENSPYQYDTAATIGTLEGHWNGTSAAGPTVAVGVSANGSFALIEGSCTATGTLHPRGSGKNVFDLSVTFGASPCAMANETATGIAVAYPLTTTGQMQLIAAVVSQSRDKGMAFFAVQ
ncbi:MAG: hypothetical protein ACJ8MR_14230, partial [Povalibacter sp.]